jgi:Lysozyme inhibitor LprI
MSRLASTEWLRSRMVFRSSWRRWRLTVRPDLFLVHCSRNSQAAQTFLGAPYPGPGLCQRDMNIQAGAELTEVENEISAVINDIKTHISGQRFREFRSAHKKWETYRNAYSTYLANCYKGGSVWPTVYCNHATYFSRKRLEELKQYLIELQEFADIC